MQMIFAATMGFVMDPKYERCECEADICACWLKRPAKGEEVRQQRNQFKLLSHCFVASGT
jgi:hypothetical protein